MTTQGQPGSLEADESNQDVSAPVTSTEGAPSQEQAESQSDGGQATLKHVFLFVVVVANVALLISLIPTEILGSQKLSSLLKVVSWLGSSVFVLGFKWLRDWILKLTEKVVFEVSQAVLFLALVLLVFSQLQIFKLHVVIEPDDAEVQIDNGKPESVASGWIEVSLQPHEIIVTDKKPDDNEQPIKRKFSLAFRDIFHAWRNPEFGIHLPLLYDVPIEVQNGINELEIRKNDRKFDPEFWNSPPKSNLGKEVKRGSESGFLVVSWKDHADSLRLPYGDYHIVARQKDCRDSEDQPVPVNRDLVIVKFTKVLNCPK
jgi:hypothetical protein